MSRFGNFVGKVGAFLDPTTNKGVQNVLNLGANVLTGGLAGDAVKKGLQSVGNNNKTPQGLPVYGSQNQSAVLPTVTAPSGAASKIGDAAKEAVRSALGAGLASVDKSLTKSSPNYVKQKEEIAVAAIANKVWQWVKDNAKMLLSVGVSITVLFSIFKYLKNRKSNVYTRKRRF